MAAGEVLPHADGIDHVASLHASVAPLAVHDGSGQGSGHALGDQCWRVAAGCAGVAGFSALAAAVVDPLGGLAEDGQAVSFSSDRRGTQIENECLK